MGPEECVAFAPHHAAPAHALSNSPHLPQVIQDIVGVETPNVPSLGPLQRHRAAEAGRRVRCSSGTSSAPSTHLTIRPLIIS